MGNGAFEAGSTEPIVDAAGDKLAEFSEHLSLHPRLGSREQ